MTTFSQKDSTIEALKQREVSLLEQLKFAVSTNGKQSEEITKYQQCVGSVALYLSVGDADGAKRVVEQFNDGMDRLIAATENN